MKTQTKMKLPLQSRRRVYYWDKFEQARKQFEAIDSMSKLIEVAIEDFKKILTRKKYDYNANFWHETNEVTEGKCAVCLAGAVMAERLEPNRNPWVLNLSPGCFEEKTHDLLMAINYIRCGDYATAAKVMKLPRPAAYGQINNHVERSWHYDFTSKQDAQMFLEYLEKKILPAIKKVEREVRRKIKERKKK